MDRRVDEYDFQVQVYLDELNPDAVKVELYAEAKNDYPAERQQMNRGESLVGSENGFVYTARIAAKRPAADYTPRLVPHNDAASVPLEAAFILWHDSPAWRK